jgi:DGQHR domain-containing protein
VNNKGPELNKRVWMLFEKAGFATKPNSEDPNEEEVRLSGAKKRTIDLSAKIEELGVKIIGSNKSGKSFNGSFSAHIHDLLQLKEKSGAQAALLVATGKRLSTEDRQFAVDKGVKLWGLEELKYYEAIVDAIGNFAKYELINSFGLKTKEQTEIHHVLALRFKQPYSESKTDVFLFTLNPELLLKVCVVFRRAQGDANAYQRILRKERLGKIKNFVTKSDVLLPTNIIVHLDKNVIWHPINRPTHDSQNNPITLAKEESCQLGILAIPKKYASLELIDGQHRLYGFIATEPATKEHFNLVVLGMRELDEGARRDTFVAINDNSRRMDPNLVAYLKYTRNEEECQKDPELMAIRLAVDLNNVMNSPFENRIRLLDTKGDQRITLKGFTGYDLKGLLGPKGQLRQYYRNDSCEFLSALTLYFNVLKSLFEKQWQDPDKYIIFQNRGVSAFLKLLKSILKTCKRKLTAPRVKKYLKPLSKQSDAFWEREKLENSYIGSKGWKDFHRDLVKIIRRDFPDFIE